MQKSNSPQPRKNRLMAQLNAQNNNNHHANGDTNSTKYLEFSLNESDHNKLFQSVRFSSPSQTSPEKLKTPTRKVNYRFDGSSPSKHSFTELLTDPNYGVKCLVAFLSLENVMLKGKVKRLDRDLGFRNILLSAKTTVDNSDHVSQGKKLKFYQAKCLELELENSKLKNQTRPGRSGSRSSNIKRKNKKLARCEQCSGKIWMEGSRQNLKTKKFSNFGKARKSTENQENEQFRANRRTSVGRAKRSRSKSALKRSKSNLSSKNLHKKGNKAVVNTRTLPISKKAFKRVLALRNSKIIAVSQMLDIHRSHLISRLKENLLFKPSIQNDADRKEIGGNIKQIVFFRWKMMHAQGAGAKMDHGQLQDEIDKLKFEGKLLQNDQRGVENPKNDLEFLHNPISTILYNNALPYTQSQYSSVLKHNNSYLKLEREELNFEKEVFFKRRFNILLKTIATSASRRYKTLKTVAFFKLIASSVFINREIYGGIGVGGGFGYKTTSKLSSGGNNLEGVIERQNNEALGKMDFSLPQGDSLLLGNSFYVMNKKPFGGDFPLNVIQQNSQPSVANLEDEWVSSNSYKPVILENDIDFLDLKVEHQNSVREDINKEEIKRKAKLYFGTSKSRNPNLGISKNKSKSPTPNGFSKVHSDLKSYQKNKITRKLTTQETLLIKKRQNFLMKKIIYRLYLRMSHTKRSSLLKWYRQTMRLQIMEYLQEFENMNIVLSERAFREKLFRTKIKVLQSKIDNKIEYFGCLMDTEIKEEQMEELRERVRAEQHAEMKKTMAMMGFNNDKSDKAKKSSRSKRSKSRAGRTKRSTNSNANESKKDSTNLNVMFNDV